MKPKQPAVDKNDNVSMTPFTKPPFIQKGYYVPLVLSNGVDFCQVDFTGSCASKDHIKGYKPCWYKKGRPNGADPIALVTPYYIFKSDRGRVEIGDFSQQFDPKTARLFTRVSMYQLEMLIETCLTDDHTLIEKYQVLKSTSEKGELLFFALFYDRSYTNKPFFVIPQQDRNLTCALKDGIPTFDYRYGEGREAFAGQGMMGVRVLRGRPRVRPCHEEKYLLRITVDRLKEGDQFARIITLVDDRDTAGWQKECERIHSRYMKAPPAVMENNATRPWIKFSKQSRFTCDERDISSQFDTSLYVCKASLHPNGSSVSALAHPNNHGMGTYWDVWYVHSALLRANRVDEARKVINFWAMVYPDARRFAEDHYKVRGARFEWVYKYDGQPHGHSDQVHQNILPALMLWDHYQYTGDKNLLRKHAGIIPDSALFLIDYAMRRDARGQWFLKELISCDESATRKKNELMTAIGIKKGIQLTRLAAGVLGKKVPRDIVNAEKPIEQILSSLKRNGVYLPYQDADTGTWATLLAYIHFSDPKIFPKALTYALEGCREPYGLGIGMTSRMRCATFPWVEGITAWAMVRNSDQRAYDYLRMVNRYTNFYGGIPEYAWLHGEPSRDWFVAAHGVFVTVLAELMARMNGDTLELFPLGLDAMPWNALSFERLRVEGGILVSLAFDRRDGIRVVLENDTAERKWIKVKWPDYDERMLLKAGHRIRREWSL